MDDCGCGKGPKMEVLSDELEVMLSEIEWEILRKFTPPEAGDAPKEVRRVLAKVYAECRQKWVDEHPKDTENQNNKEKCARIAWSAAQNVKHNYEVVSDAFSARAELKKMAPLPNTDTFNNPEEDEKMRKKREEDARKGRAPGLAERMNRVLDSIRFV